MKSELKKEKPAAKKFIIGTLVVFMVIASSVAVLLKYPQIFQHRFMAQNEVNDLLLTRVEILEKKIATLENKSSPVQQKDITDLRAKFDHFSKDINQSLSFKAETSDVSRLLHQVAQLETKVKASGSQNALILTALGFVENASKNGQPFVYEASVLKGICMGTELESDAEQISKIALNGINTDQELIEKFQIIYDEALQTSTQMQQRETVPDIRSDWKAFLLYKLKHLIVFEKIKKQNETMKTSEKEVLQTVQKGDFATAFHLMESLPFFQTENFEIWKETCRKRADFEQLVEKMKAYTLGALKVEIIKK